MCDCDCELNKYVKWAEIRREERASITEYLDNAADLTKKLLKGTPMGPAIEGTLRGAADFVSPFRCTLMCSPDDMQHTYEKGCLAYE